MVDDASDGSLNIDTLMLIDYDNAAWGYRAWDINYYFSKWFAWPTEAVMEDFIDAYLLELNKNENVMTPAEVMTEIRNHQPYVLMEQMLFYYLAIDGYMSPAHKNAYCDVMQNHFKRQGRGTKVY